MLMVILGAGASYDSIPSRSVGVSPADPARPPLADALFEARESFERILRQTPLVMPIAPELQRRPADQSVEDVLARLAGEATTYPHRESQLAAVRFYLQAIIEGCEKQWFDARPLPTNLMALHDQIERARGDRTSPIYVTFNYDRLIELSLANRGHRYDSLDAFVRQGQPNVFKLHGSIDWVRPLGRMDATRFGGSAWNMAHQVCESIRTLPAPGAIQHVRGVPGIRARDDLAIPAIAVPLKSKSSFECPDAHVDLLATKLQQVRTILTIGWRGGEEHFLSLLRKNALERVEVICVGGSISDATQTAENLNRALRGAHIEPRGEGFSEFVTVQGLNRLLNITWGPY